VSGIKPFIVFAMTSLYFPIVSGSEGPDHFVPDAMLLQMDLKHGRFIPIGSKTISEFGTIVCLNTFNRAGKSLNQMIQEHGRRISIMLFKSLNKAPAGEFIDGGILEELFANDPGVFETGRGNKFDINLNALTGIIHLFIGFRDVFRVRWFYGHNALFSKETIQAGNGAGIASLPEFNPKDDETGIRISAAHIIDEFDFIRSMLIGMVVWPSGAIAQGIPGSVVASEPSVDILAVSFVLDSSFSNAMFVGVTN